MIKKAVKNQSEQAQIKHPLSRFFLREEVELSNTRTAYVMHIPTTLSLTSARNNRKQKLQ